MPEKKSRNKYYMVFPLFMIILILLSAYFFIKYWSIFETRESFEMWLESWGKNAPFIFILIQFIQVVVFILPGEIPQIAGGYIFGAVYGFILSNIGIISGALFNYSVGKLFGSSFIKKIISDERFERFEYLMRSENVLLPMLILFLIPGIPKDALSYFAGLTSIKLFPFLFISLIGRAPGIIMSTVFGDAAAEKNWLVLISVSVLTFIMIFLAVLLKKKENTK